VGASLSHNPYGPSRPVTGIILLYFLIKMIGLFSVMIPYCLADGYQRFKECTVSVLKIAHQVAKVNTKVLQYFTYIGYIAFL
jgi:hypothetical protein